MFISLPRLVMGGCLASSLPAGPAGHAQPPEEALVFLEYTQKQLDRNYTQADWAPNIDQVLQRYALRSELTRKRLGDPERFDYGGPGRGGATGLDLFRAAPGSSPVLVYIHGGAWRSGMASSYHFPADMFKQAGISYIALDFNNVLEVGLDGMIAQIRQALQWIYRNADALGVDRHGIHVCGHSSGAHLGGVLLTTDWTEYGLPADLIKGATLLSGMYDLAPVRLSVRASYVPFNDDIEHSMSAMRHLDRIGTPLILAYGSLETDEFKRQSASFAHALREAGKSVELIVLEHYNHFEIMDDFGNPYNPVAAAAIGQVLG